MEVPKKVWIVIEEHRAEGASVLGVFGHEPSQGEIDELESSYDLVELASWCKRHVDVYEVKHSGTTPPHPD